MNLRLLAPALLFVFVTAQLPAPPVKEVYIYLRLPSLEGLTLGAPLSLQIYSCQTNSLTGPLKTFTHDVPSSILTCKYGLLNSRLV
jgi:hypothetical protein